MNQLRKEKTEHVWGFQQPQEKYTVCFNMEDCVVLYSTLASTGDLIFASEIVFLELFVVSSLNKYFPVT